MTLIDLVGVGIIKNLPSSTGGQGGRPAPRALQDKRRGVGGQFQRKPVENTIYYQSS